MDSAAALCTQANVRTERQMYNIKLIKQPNLTIGGRNSGDDSSSLIYLNFGELEVILFWLPSCRESRRPETILDDPFSLSDSGRFKLYDPPSRPP